MQTKSLLTATIALMIFFGSCKKYNQEQPPSKTDLLTSGEWRMTAFRLDTNSNGDYETDHYTKLPACQRDNYNVFKRDGTIEQNEGPTKCGASLPQIIQGDWRFDNNEKEIWINGGPYTILELTTSTFRIKGISIVGTSEITYNK